MLAALDYAPLTARQLGKLSETFASPFGAARLARERLQRMAAAKLVTSHRYAILRPGQPENYYQLTRDGYQLVHGPDAEPPSKGYFSPIGLARQPHQYALSDFIVHTAWGAHGAAGVQLVHFQRENSLRIDAGGDTVYPDCSFVLTRNTDEFRFFVEIDNGTERIESLKECDSIERKLRTYDTFQDSSPASRFRVLFVSARNSPQRLKNILRIATRVIRDSNRTLVYAITMMQYLAMSHPVTSPQFVDHRGDQHPLIPDVKLASPRPAAVLLTAHVQC